MDDHTSDADGYGWEWVEDPSVSVQHASSPAENTMASGLHKISASSSLEGFSLGMPQAESLSSAASSPVDQGFLVSVVAKDDDRSANTEEQSSSDWVEPQLVFFEAQSCQFQSFDMFDAYRLLENVPEAKEVIDSILSDPAVWDAVRKNKRLQELTCHMHQCVPNDGYRSGMMKLETCISHNTDMYGFGAPSVLYSHGRHAFEILKKKFAAVADVLVPFWETWLVKRVGDPLDRKMSSCVILVAIVLMLIISKRPHM